MIKKHTLKQHIYTDQTIFAHTFTHCQWSYEGLTQIMENPYYSIYILRHEKSFIVSFCCIFYVENSNWDDFTAPFNWIQMAQ